MNETQSFSMHSTFPKRDYSEADMSKTLRDLQLAPSATILIIPVSFCNYLTFHEFILTYFK
jgi:hypothetical protein